MRHTATTDDARPGACTAQRRPIPGALALACLLLGLGAGASIAQPENPVYVDDAPAAEQVLGEIDGLLGRDNAAEAVRALQRLLETEPDRLINERADPDLYRSVRDRVHAALLVEPALLDRYRATVGPSARAALERGEAQRVEIAMLLTEAGADAAIQLASERYRRADFDAALRLLAPLETHPDRAGDRGMRAAALLAEIARFIADEPRRTSLGAQAGRWAAEAGGRLAADALEPVPAPESALRSGYGPFNPMAPTDAERLLPRPLRSMPLDPAAVSDESLRPPDDPAPWILPTAAGDTLLVNDGTRLSAFDAASLERLWTHEPTASSAAVPGFTGRANVAQTVSEGLTVVADRGVVLGVTGLATGNRRSAGQRLNAVELDSGSPMWSASPSEIDPDLAGAVFFGPPLIEGDTAVVGVFTFAPLRRVHVAHLAGLDLYTGRTKWVRLLGTAGVLPSQRTTDSAPIMLAREGVVYRVEPLGVAAAIEAHTGRPRWVRRLGSAEETSSRRPPWEAPQPIAVAGSIVTITPDRTELIALGPDSGTIVARRPMADLGSPNYFLHAGEHLVGLGGLTAAVVPAVSAFDAEPARLAVGAGPITGRAIVSGDRIVLPTDRGVTLLDAASASAETVGLERPGSPVVARGQLLLVSGTRAHGYLDWANAERVLSGRIADHPADPQHAIALAELAGRAGRPARVPAAADDALNAIARLVDRGDEGEAVAARSKLFRILAAVLDAEFAPTDAGGPGPGAIPVGDRGAIVERLERAARMPSQRVGHLMRRAAWHEQRREHDEAAGDYQRILADEILARAEHTVRWRRQRADLASTAALARLLAEHGPGFYSRFDRDAERAIAALHEQDAVASTATPDAPELDLNPQEPGPPAVSNAERAEGYERLARRFPVAKVAAEAWLASSRAHLEAADRRASIAAARSGLEAAVRQPQRRRDREVAAELAGRLASMLAEDDRVFEAASIARRARAELRLTSVPIGNEEVRLDSLEQSLRSRLIDAERLPRVSDNPGAMVQVLGGWKPIAAASQTGPIATAAVLLRNDSLGLLALWSTAGETDPTVDLAAARADGSLIESEPRLRPVWSRPLGDDPFDDVRLVRLTATEALLIRGQHTEARLESIETISGTTNWSTPAFGSLFDEEPPELRTGAILTPLDGRAWLRDQVLAVGRRTAITVERSGRASAVDMQTGEVLWARRLDVPAVYEASLADGVLTVIGERPSDPAQGERSVMDPVVAGYDARSGAPLFEPIDPGSYARWVRHRPGSPPLIGLDSGVAALDPARSGTRWVVDDPAVRLSGDAWIMPGRAYVLGPDRQLWQIDTAAGRLGAASLEDLGRIAEATQVTAHTLPDGSALFAGTEGVVMFNADGRLIGGDGFDGSRRFRLPAVAEGLVVAVDANRLPADRVDTTTLPAFGLAVMETPSGRLRTERLLELFSTPRSLTVIDDHLLIGTDRGTVVYDARTDR